MAKLSLVPKISEELQNFISCFPGKQIFCTISKNGVQHRVGTLEEHFSDLYFQNSNNLSEVYFTVNTSSSDRRIISDMVEARAVFIDVDQPAAEPISKHLLKPSIIVETSPGKYHYYWLTSTKDLSNWKKVQKKLIKLYNSDPAIHDTTRVLRLPSFQHRDGFRCRVVENNHTVYTWEDILLIFTPVYDDQHETTQDSSDFSLPGCINSFQSGKSIAPSLNSLIMHWSYRYSETNIEEMIQDLYDNVEPQTYVEHKTRYDGARKQVKKFINSAKNTVKKKLPELKLYLPGDIVIPTSLEWDWSQLKKEIPAECLPDTLSEAAKEIGEWSGIGPEPAILSAVFVTSSLLCKNVLIHEIEDCLTTHCQCGVIIVMDTGGRKSAIYEQMNKPFFDYEKQLTEEWEKEKQTNDAVVKLIDKQIKALENSFKPSGETSLGAEMLAVASQMGGLMKARDSVQLKRPWLRTSDATEEKLIRKLDENHGTIAIISDDARQVISHLVGKYSKDFSGESVYINALTGSDIIYERVGSEKEIHIKKPVLNAVLFVQPDAALVLKNSPMYVPSGLAARLPLYFFPVVGANILKNTERRLVDENKMRAYYDNMKKLCLRRFDCPLNIRLSDAGMAKCRTMDKEFAKLLESKWAGQYDKTNKLITLSIMYSTVFAALDDPNFQSKYARKDESLDYILPLKYLNMGFMFAISLFGQSIQSYISISNEGIPRMAIKVLDKLKEWHIAGFIQEGFTDCGHLSNRFSVTIRPHLTECLQMLASKGWLHVTMWDGEPRKMRGGFLDKIINPGDFVYHVNMDGIRQRDALQMDKTDDVYKHFFAKDEIKGN